MTEPTRLSDDECRELFDTLFPEGFAGPDVQAELAPEGWEASPLKAVFHPSPEQVYEESVQMHRNIQRLKKKQQEGEEEAGEEADGKEPTLAEIEADWQDPPADPEREVRELVGMCVWDIFSDNHEVTAADGRVADLGSQRGSAGFIAEWVNTRLGHPPSTPEDEMQRIMDMANAMQAGNFDALKPRERGGTRVYGYEDFYMGTAMVRNRTDLSPVYRMIFARLQRLGCDWTYHYPELHLVDFRPLQEQMEAEEMEEGGEDFAVYDPSEAFAKEQENQQRDAELAEMREDIDQGNREARAQAAKDEPPTVVQAYNATFGHLPRGWPPA